MTTPYSIGNPAPAGTGALPLPALTTPAKPNILLGVVNPNDTVTAPANSAGGNQVMMLGQVSSAASADIARVFFSGHSYLGYLNTEGGEDYPRRVGAALHAEVVPYAFTGGTLATDLSGGNSGGYANVVNALTPRIFSGTAYTPRNSAPYFPVSPVTVFNWGFNDLSFLTATTATNVAWFSMALSACCCIARAGGFFPDTDSSVAFSSGWTAETGNQNFGWPTDHFATTTAKTVTITVPSSFEGGEICLFSLAYAGGTKWSTTVDGGAAQVLDGTGSAFGSNSGHANLVVQRLTGLAAGTHTIVMTVSALDGSAVAIFEGWTITSPSLPAVVLVNQPDAPGLPLTVGGAPHTPITSADVTALNAGIAAVAAGFTDGNVLVADIATAFAAANGNVAAGSPGSLWVATDEVHPNAAGHGLIAQTVRDTIRSAPLPTAARMCAEAILWRIVGAPLEPQFKNSWVASGTTMFGRDRAGNTVLRLDTAHTGTPAAGTTIFTLPPGYGSAGFSGFTGVAWDASFVAPGAFVGWCDNGNGNVQYGSGSSVTEIFAGASWVADALGY